MALSQRFSDCNNAIILTCSFLIVSLVALIQNSNTNQSNNDIFSIFKILNKIPNAFPETLKIITILLTYLFQLLQMIVYFRRLSFCEERNSFTDLNQAVDMFGAMKTRRYPVTA
ncbi:zinc finger MYM-type protein 1-like [Aphis craccivora]|uniref:Zinc finger MYM-type protein 1-like n=1 Tax=Aphis craccivora TaxID=307492 RepID=A0A6G0Z6B0_APHCR|nr:zinc finger MYM-type protein 1-like [Aphis craccivora]